MSRAACITLGSLCDDGALLLHAWPCYDFRDYTIAELVAMGNDPDWGPGVPDCPATRASDEDVVRWNHPESPESWQP